jgi:Flp pilus assembly protein TadB
MLTSRQRQNLQLRNTSVAEFYGDKAALALTGALLPGLLAALWTAVFDLPLGTPAIVALVGLVVGFFVPDLMLRSGAKGTRTDAGDALLTYIDLVTLERLANASATQALHNAADLSDVPLFTQIRGALERARLEQQPPYAELRKLAVQLNLPELADVADVMQLDETGAALSGALRARVRELRDAHLTKAQNEANAASEGMTIYMSVPALIFGLIFMAPPLMRIAFG